MKHIYSYNELFIEDLLNESLSSSKEFIKNLFKNKNKFVAIDFNELKNAANAAGHSISMDMQPNLKSLNNKKNIDYLTYEKNLRKKLESSIITTKDADNYFKKILNSSFEKATKLVIGTILLSVMLAKDYKISYNIANDKESKEIISELNNIKDSDLKDYLFNDNIKKFIEPELEPELEPMIAILPNIKIFMDTVANIESGNNPDTINTIGYIGKYQFGKSALEESGYGHITIEEFKKRKRELWSEEEQNKAMLNLLGRNKFILRHYIDKYEGTVINGIDVTESGILAAAHLGGHTSIKDYLDSNGEQDNKDIYGTKISEYLLKFKTYNLNGLKTLKIRPKEIKT